MIETIELNSPKTVGIRISGKIEKPDIEALIRDMKFGLPNRHRFDKKALVSRKDWFARLVEIGDKLFPSIEVKHFATDQKDEARQWVTA